MVSSKNSFRNVDTLLMDTDEKNCSGCYPLFLRKKTNSKVDENPNLIELILAARFCNFLD